MESPLWIIAAFVIVQVTAQSESMYTSSNQPSFYRGEQGTFACQVKTSDEVTKDSVTGFGLKRTPLDGSDGVPQLQCVVNFIPGAPSTASAATDSTVSNADCATAYREFAANGVATFQVRWEMQDTGSYSCFANARNVFSVSDAEIRVEELLVAPTSLTMMVKPDQVYAGNSVEIMCQSEGGDPVADLEYSVDGEVIGNTIDPFLASPDDNGKEYSCEDLSHRNYADESVTSQKRTLDVYYLKPTMERKAEIVNPKETKTLSCATMSNLPDGESLAYSWSKDGNSLESDMEIITVGQNANLNETLVEMYTCKVRATDVNIPDIMVYFNITWNPDSTTKALPTTTPTQKPQEKVSSPNKKDVSEESNGTTTIIVVVVVVVTVIILIVVVVVIVVKRRNSNSANVTKEAGPVPVKGDVEKGPGDADAAAEPMLTESDRGEKDADESGKQ